MLSTVAANRNQVQTELTGFFKYIVVFVQLVDIKDLEVTFELKPNCLFQIKFISLHLCHLTLIQELKPTNHSKRLIIFNFFREHQNLCRKFYDLVLFVFEAKFSNNGGVYKYVELSLLQRRQPALDQREQWRLVHGINWSMTDKSQKKHKKNITLDRKFQIVSNFVVRLN